MTKILGLFKIATRASNEKDYVDHLMKGDPRFSSAEIFIDSGNGFTCGGTSPKDDGSDTPETDGDDADTVASDTAFFVLDAAFRFAFVVRVAAVT